MKESAANRITDMGELTVAGICSAEFRLFSGNPVIFPFGGSPMVADPSLLTPSESPDGLWHLFCHTLTGVWQFVSEDGIHFRRAGRIVPRAMRPDINRIGNRYYLYYERTRSLAANGLNMLNLTPWRSSIYLTQSDDLIHWSKPESVLEHTKPFEESERGVSLSNPFLLREGDTFRLYYSCGLTYIKDCGFCEPTHISYAVSESPDGGFTAVDKPLISPDSENPYLNLCSGCLKVYRLSDGYIGIQNGIYLKDGGSRSAILLLTSEDGLKFEFNRVLVEPDGKDGSWMRQFVYASHLVCYDGKLRLYFNARNTAAALSGRECIGFAEAEI
ncbi:MAG: glycosyl hydrolase family 43 [Clostridia bacterium]|nr:glycosyl hydrolase family 43 [Clostridia bacterium]